MCPEPGRPAIETGPTVTILNNVLIVLIFLTSILLTLTILMHKGQGGGLSDMFGGGISSSAGSSGVADGHAVYLAGMHHRIRSSGEVRRLICRH